MPEDPPDHRGALQQRLRARRAAGRCARRSAPAACRGSARRRVAAPRASIRIVSSTKSGLPSVLSSSAAARSAGSSPSCERARRRAPRSPRRPAARARSRSRAGARRPSPAARRAARAARGRRSGAAPRAPTPARCSISSSSGSSAQWMSSKTSTSGCASASCSAHSRAAQAISCWLRSRSHRLEHARREPEQVGDRLVLAARAELLDRLVERVVVGDPGRGLDHLGERPVRDRPRRRAGSGPASTVAPSSPSTNSRARRLLPTPGSP